ncbi:MAG TPA: hypothetical protein VFT99_18590, partial [Roseiflexaceae bacterium]|nr:hypothetical protein [Roseiflexaceae bacterium]
MDLFVRLAAYFRAVDPLGTVDVVPIGTPFEKGQSPSGVVATVLFACTPASFRPAPSGSAMRHTVLNRQSPLADIEVNLNTN